ncbi:hypothetical protein Ahy_A08g039182 isoform B [Arachis hypogaea]|uniref:Uncharacterized protein n=1 Tax=Arachis hypogaea TaxID=3818 RepID=A0A445BVI1_ARAHY|nr:hypothetical protein Ahy_A08g039182 isoform B [Arachis hypogaea]
MNQNVYLTVQLQLAPLLAGGSSSYFFLPSHVSQHRLMSDLALASSSGSSTSFLSALLSGSSVSVLSFISRSASCTMKPKASILGSEKLLLENLEAWSLVFLSSFVNLKLLDFELCHLTSELKLFSNN